MFIIKTIILSFTICIDSFIICVLNKTNKKYNYFLIPLIFSFFQTFFLLTGYIFGDWLEELTINYLKYIIFFILSSMGLKLIIDILINKGKEKACNFALKEIFFQAFITSFDSLFLGVPLAFSTNTYIILIIIIGLTTFFLCLLGLLLRNKLSNNIEEKISIIGSIILFIFAIKSLL